MVAHRGASAYAPENTLAAIEEAARMGATWVEFDVRLAACGTPVLLHDATLDRTTTARGRLAGTTAEALARIDAGSRFNKAFAGEPVPTLEAVLDLATRLGLGLNVEIKADDAAEARRTAEGAGRVLATWPGELVVSSFEIAALEALRTSGLPLGLLKGRAVTADDLAFAESLGAWSLHAHHRAFASALVAAVAARGLVPVTYTVNDADRAAALWAMGVRSVITDRPDVLLEARSAVTSRSGTFG